MKRVFLAAAMLTLLTGCETIDQGVNIFVEYSCGDPAAVRMGKLLVFNGYTGAGIEALDCDGDGKPDDVGTYTPPAP